VTLSLQPNGSGRLKKPHPPLNPRLAWARRLHKDLLGWPAGWRIGMLVLNGQITTYIYTYILLYIYRQHTYARYLGMWLFVFGC
jgi:hypothetical protein